MCLQKTEEGESENPPPEEPMDGEHDEDVDEDEIELHAGDDVAEDEENDQDDNGPSWNRRTRSAKLSN